MPGRLMAARRAAAPALVLSKWMLTVSTPTSALGALLWRTRQMQRRHPMPTIKTDEFEADTGQNIGIVVSDLTPSVCRTALILNAGAV